MKQRERGHIWPVISVATGAFFILVVVPLVFQREKSARMATVDPQVTIGDSGIDSAAESDSSSSAQARGLPYDTREDRM